jgi:ABC-2 type transport system ATP-binding protein
MLAIQTENLSKSFGKGSKYVQALKNVNLKVEPGQVFGFLGPNGAGKTTTIRVLMNLIRPNGGRASIFGHDVQTEREILQRVGAMVENPAFYGYMSGRANLAVLAHTSGVYDSKLIDSLLTQVGLTTNADRPVKGYSLGMKQRLGIAAALLNNPDLVLMDEPTNGLDPAGIQEMRAFIRSMAEEQQKTVFICSHLLYEVEQVCDRVAIINKGELVQEGLVKELLKGGQAEISLEVRPLEKAAKILGKTWSLRTEEPWLIVIASPEDTPKMIDLLSKNRIEVHQVIRKQSSLEEFFMAVTQEEAGDAA